MMEKTRIHPVTKVKTINYGDKIVENFWLRINPETKTEYESNNLEKIIAVFNDVQDSVICIQTEKLDQSNIIKAIFNASKKRNRIYILTNEIDKALEQLEGVCLIRYGIKNIGSFILVNPNTSYLKGIIYTAPFMETSLANADNLTLELDNYQVKTLFRFFSDNFWNKAKFEIIDNFNTPKETGEPPLDFLPNIKDFCYADFVKNKISEVNIAEIVSVPSLQTNDLLNFASFQNSEILISLKNNDAELLKTVATNKNSIKAIELNTVRIIISENGSWLIPKTNISENDNFFALKLNKTQTNELEKIEKNRFNKAEYEFYLSKTRKDLENKTIKLLDNIDDEIIIKSEAEKKMNDIILDKLLPKEEFEKQEPEFEDDNVSIKINFEWKIVPFYTPKNAQKAKLYLDWEKYQKEYNSFLERIEKAINESENKSIGESLKRWFLGKKQTISKQQEQLDALKLKDLSILEKSKRKEIVKELNQLAKSVSANLSEINTEIKKSEINTEIEQLNEQKKENEHKLEKFIEEQEKKIKEKEENKEELLKTFLEKYNIKKEEINKYKSEWQRKKNKKKEEIAEDQKKLEELKDIEGFNFRKKFEDDKQRFEKEIKSIDDKIKSKQKEFAKAGKEQQQTESSSLNSVIGKGQNNKNSKQSNDFSIPDNIEYLPKIGQLYEVGKQKYLEIEFWEYYEDALQESKRFNAKLSVKQL